MINWKLLAIFVSEKIKVFKIAKRQILLSK